MVRWLGPTKVVRWFWTRRKPRGLNLGLMLGSNEAWTWHWVHPVWMQVLDHLLIPVWTPVQLVAQALQVVVRALKNNQTAKNHPPVSTVRALKVAVKAGASQSTPGHIQDFKDSFAMIVSVPLVAQTAVDAVLLVV